MLSSFELDISCGYCVTDEYEITNKKINCITTDNAANNGFMGNKLEIAAKIRKDFKFKKNEQLIGRMSHIINLACQELIVKDLKSIAPPNTSNLYLMMKNASILFHLI